MSESSADGATMRAYLAARERARRDRGARLAAEVHTALPAMLARLRALGARRVWVFGSLSDGTFDEQSDLDLAVEGLPPERFLDARVALTELAPVAVDLIELERARAELRAIVQAEGRELTDAG